MKIILLSVFVNLDKVTEQLVLYFTNSLTEMKICLYVGLLNQICFANKVNNFIVMRYLAYVSRMLTQILGRHLYFHYQNGVCGGYSNFNS